MTHFSLTLARPQKVHRYLTFSGSGAPLFQTQPVTTGVFHEMECALTPATGISFWAEIFLQRSVMIQSWQLIYSPATPLSKSIYECIHRQYFTLKLLEKDAEQSALFSR